MDILSFYENKYGEFAQIPLEQFSLWEMRAKAELNRLTFGKFDNLSEYTENIKFCICEIAEALRRDSENEGKASESNDGYSVTFNNENIQERIKTLAEKYLDAELLYRGY